MEEKKISKVEFDEAVKLAIHEQVNDPEDEPKNVNEPAGEMKKLRNFGWAIAALKKGKKVARKNWNGKGMFLFLAHSMDITTDADLSCVKDLEGDLVSPSIVMKTADDRFCVGWLASQTDMLADDWYEVQ